jgi:hypothetical protein
MNNNIHNIYFIVMIVLSAASFGMGMFVGAY